MPENAPYPTVSGTRLDNPNSSQRLEIIKMRGGRRKLAIYPPSSCCSSFRRRFISRAELERVRLPIHVTPRARETSTIQPRVRRAPLHRLDFFPENSRRSVNCAQRRRRTGDAARFYQGLLSSGWKGSRKLDACSSIRLPVVTQPRFTRGDSRNRLRRLDWDASFAMAGFFLLNYSVTG